MPAVQRISEPDLAVLVERQAGGEAAAGHVRDIRAFQAHLIDVAVRAERVATALSAVLPPDEVPDPIVAFVAGAWHDGGKIRSGDDYHEIPSALDVLERGLEWGLVSGPREQALKILTRAARAILPGFALYEQWQTDYVPTYTPRRQFEAAYAQLAAMLRPSLGGEHRDRALLLPHRVEALVVMYSDMCNLVRGDGISAEFSTAFDARWMDIERRAQAEDPGLLSVLPAARPRVHDGCALVHAWLTTGYDASGLARFRSSYCMVSSRSQGP